MARVSNGTVTVMHPPQNRSIISYHRSIAVHRRSIAPCRRSIAPCHHSISSRHRSIAPCHHSNASRHRPIASHHRPTAPCHRSIASRHRNVPSRSQISTQHVLICPSLAITEKRPLTEIRMTCDVAAPLIIVRRTSIAVRRANVMRCMRHLCLRIPFYFNYAYTISL